MVVCQCERITERRVVRAVQAGASTVREVGRATGAGQGCGCCVSSLKQIIEQHFVASPRAEYPHEAA